jgi:hypothetical protein
MTVVNTGYRPTLLCPCPVERGAGRVPAPECLIWRSRRLVKEQLTPVWLQRPSNPNDSRCRTRCVADVRQWGGWSPSYAPECASSRPEPITPHVRNRSHMMRFAAAAPFTPMRLTRVLSRIDPWGRLHSRRAGHRRVHLPRRAFTGPRPGRRTGCAQASQQCAASGPARREPGAIRTTRGWHKTNVTSGQRSGALHTPPAATEIRGPNRISTLDRPRSTRRRTPPPDRTPPCSSSQMPSISFQAKASSRRGGPACVDTSRSELAGGRLPRIADAPEPDDQAERIGGQELDHTRPEDGTSTVRFPRAGA